MTEQNVAVSKVKMEGLGQKIFFYQESGEDTDTGSECLIPGSSQNRVRWCFE